MSSNAMRTTNDELGYSSSETEMNKSNPRRRSLVARQISFSHRGATCGEILLILCPYLILLFDIFLYFVLRGL